MANAFNKILLKGEPRYDEGRAGGAIKPGQLIKRHTDGTYIVHATAGGPGQKLIAIEDSLQGKTIDNAYASGDLVRFQIAHSGDVLFCYIDATENVADGGALMSTGNGNFDAVTSTNFVFGHAQQAINLSASGAVATRIPVQFA